MSFFKKFIGLFASFGFVFVLFSVVFLVYNSIDNSPKENISIIEESMYLSEDIDESIWHEENNTIYLMVLFKEPHDKNYYLSYAYHYFDTYNKPVHLIAEDNKGSYFVTIDNKGVSSIS